MKAWRVMALIAGALTIRGAAALAAPGDTARQDQINEEVVAAKSREGAVAKDIADAKSAYDRKDYAAARKLWRRAADEGSPAAQYSLGLMSAAGMGESANNGEAAKWFRKAADQGLAQAQFSLGMLYLEGGGVAKDDAQGAAWLRRAADQGLAQAQFNLGVLYENGQGVTKDLKAADDWYGKAAAQGLK